MIYTEYSKNFDRNFAKIFKRHYYSIIQSSLKILWFHLPLDFTPLQFPARSLVRAVSVEDNVDNLTVDDHVLIWNRIQVDVVPIIFDNVNVVVGPFNAAVGSE